MWFKYISDKICFMKVSKVMFLDFYIWMGETYAGVHYISSLFKLLVHWILEKTISDTLDM